MSVLSMQYLYAIFVEKGVSGHQILHGKWTDHLSVDENHLNLPVVPVGVIFWTGEQKFIYTSCNISILYSNSNIHVKCFCLFFSSSSQK